MSDIDAELADWVQVCRQFPFDPLQLNALERWMAVHESRRLLLARAVAAAAKHPAKNPTAANVGERIEQILYIEHSAARLPRAARRRLAFGRNDVRGQAAAWLRHLLSFSSTQFDTAWDKINAVCSRDRALLAEFSRLFSLWTGVLSTKYLLIFDRLPSPPLPPVPALSVRKLEKLAAQFDELGLQLRIPRWTTLPRWESCRSESDKLTSSNDHWGNRLHLYGDSELQWYMDPESRELRLLRGELFLCLKSYAGWPGVLQVDDLLLHSLDVCCALSYRAPGCVEILLLNGTLSITRMTLATGERSELATLCTGDHAWIGTQHLEVRNLAAPLRYKQLHQPSAETFFLKKDSAYSELTAQHVTVHAAPWPQSPPLAVQEPSERLLQQAGEWIERCEARYCSPQTLNEVRAWLDTDLQRLLLLRQLRANHQELNARLKEFKEPPRQIEPKLRAALQRFKPKPQPVICRGKWAMRLALMRVQRQALALLREVERGQFSDDAQLAIFPTLEAQPLLYMAYRQLLFQWLLLLQTHKRLLLLGRPVAHLPRLEQLTPRRLQALYAKYAPAAQSLRLPQYVWQPQWTATRTARGERAKHELESDDELHLNTESEVRFYFTPQRRRYSLLRGEMHLEPYTDVEWPIVVDVDGLRITTLDATFGVRRHAAGGVEVYVGTGVVCLTRHTGYELCAPARGKSIWVKRNQWLRLDAKQVQLFDIDLDTSLALGMWQVGELHFHATPLGRVIAEYNRYLEGPLLYAEPALADTPITGNYATTDPALMLDMLRAQYGIQTEHCRREDGEVLRLFKAETI